MRDRPKFLSPSSVSLGGMGWDAISPKPAQSQKTNGLGCGCGCGEEKEVKWSQLVSGLVPANIFNLWGAMFVVVLRASTPNFWGTRPRAFSCSAWSPDARLIATRASGIAEEQLPRCMLVRLFVFRAILKNPPSVTK